MLNQILEILKLFLVILISNSSYLFIGWFSLDELFLVRSYSMENMLLNLSDNMSSNERNNIYSDIITTFCKCSFSKWRLRLEYCKVLSLKTQGFYLLFQIQQKSLCLQHAQSSRMICIFKLLFAFIYDSKKFNIQN